MSDDLARLAADLGNAGREAARKTNTAVAKTAADASAIAQSLAAVDTGYMRSSVGWDMIAAGAAEFGATAHYAPHVEYGTYKMAPQPFIHPAADAVTPSLEAAIAQIAGEVLT